MGGCVGRSRMDVQESDRSMTQSKKCGGKTLGLSRFTPMGFISLELVYLCREVCIKRPHRPDEAYRVHAFIMTWVDLCGCAAAARTSFSV